MARIDHQPPKIGRLPVVAWIVPQEFVRMHHGHQTDRRAAIPQTPDPRASLVGRLRQGLNVARHKVALIFPNLGAMSSKRWSRVMSRRSIEACPSAPASTVGNVAPQGESVKQGLNGAASACSAENPRRLSGFML